MYHGILSRFRKISATFFLELFPILFRVTKLTTYRVFDSIMGSGKTTKIIEELRKVDSGQHRYIMVSPYLTEVERITKAVPELNFKNPVNDKTSKLADFHQLIEAGDNIVSTHSLFQSWSPTTLDKLQSQGYELIIDETVDCTRDYGSGKGELSSSDIMLFIETDLIKVGKDQKLRWNPKKTLGYKSKFKQLKDDCDAGRLYYMAGDDEKGLMFWEFPIELLNVFQSVTILTYLFDGSMMSAYLGGHDIVPERFVIDIGHNLLPWTEELEGEGVASIAALINLVEDDKLNEVGRLDNAFSTSWLKAQSPKKYEEIAKKTRSTLQNTFGAKKDTAMWSCTKAYQDLLSPTGFKGAYVVCNIRATNEYRKREHLAYLRNIYMFPRLWQFYKAMRAIEPRHDDYALAELLQWVFRSAIRDGRAIDLYLPSSRMRKLLKGWMSSGRIASNNG